MLSGFHFGYIDDLGIKESYEQFVEYAKDTGLGSRLTTSQDIDEMDRVLFMAIEHVKQKLKGGP
jgi:hypothetical protein